MLDRRVLLGGAAAVGLGSLLGAESGAGRMRFSKSLKIGMIEGARDLTHAFQIATDAGFDGVELDSPNGYEVAEVVAAKEATGSKVPGVVLSTHWHKPFSAADRGVRAEAVEALETAIDDCAAYGGDTVLVVPGVVNAATSYAAAYERSQHELAKVLPRCLERGVKLAFENVWNGFLLSPLEAARYVDEFESDAVGWYFDVGNVVNFGWPHHWIESLGERILKLDVKEFSRKRRDEEGLWRGFEVEIGDGDCEWPRVVRALAAVGYRGWASAEVAGGDVERLREIAGRMDRVLAL
ncbi:MAG: sugar phosphate isomerase/epimerase family protein [Planctomycetota bacterium]